MKGTFKELYEETKKQQSASQIFIRDVAQACCKSENTVRMWLTGRQTPDALTQQVLAAKFKTTPKKLFPL